MRAVTKREPRTAVSRAVHAWGECALHTRQMLRERGVRGELRTLDEIAAKQRGKAVPKGIAAFAMELRDAGVEPDAIIAQLQGVVAQMVRGLCIDAPNRSA